VDDVVPVDCAALVCPGLVDVRVFGLAGSSAITCPALELAVFAAVRTEPAGAAEPSMVFSALAPTLSKESAPRAARLFPRASFMRLFPYQF
jgi:hypothetical protein